MGTDKNEIARSDLSCTFCGPGTWAVWDVVTEDGVFFVCEKHHFEMGDAKIIALERRIGKKDWREPDNEENVSGDKNNLNDFFDITEYERRDTY
jgi:hypothetical protein